MPREDKRARRARREKKRRARAKARNEEALLIHNLGHNHPTLGELVGSLDLRAFKRLLGVFCCEPEKYLATEAVLEENGHTGYSTLQGLIDGERGSGGDSKVRGWTAAVKRASDDKADYRVFVGVVKQPSKGNDTEDTVARWGEIIAVFHELGHAADMESGVHFRVGIAYNLEDAEYFAHQFACRLLRQRGMTMGIIAYLSMAVCSVLDDTSGSIGPAARRFLASDEYRACYQMIPPPVRDNFGIRKPLPRKKTDAQTDSTA